MLVGGHGALHPHAFASLVAFSTVTRSLAGVGDAFARAVWDRYPSSTRAHTASRTWLRELRMRSGIGGALASASTSDGGGVRFTLGDSREHRRVSLAVGPRQCPPAMDDVLVRVLEVTVHASGRGFDSIGVAALASADRWDSDRRLAVRTPYGKSPLCGVAWVASSGALLRLDDAESHTISRVVTEVHKRPWAWTPSPQSTSWGDEPSPPFPFRLRLEVVPRARTLRVQRGDGVWSAPVPLDGLIDDGWTFAATIYNRTSLAFVLWP